MADRTVNVTINYKVNTAEVQKAQAASQAAQKATDQLRKSAQQYGPESAKAMKQSADGAKMAAREVQSLNNQFNSLYNSVKLFLTAGIAKEIVDITLNMALLKGRIEGVTIAFDKLPNSITLFNSLKQATHGTVTDLELMQKALRANNFKIPLENLGKLFEFAATKAQQTGQEVNHLVEYIVSGIGYRSIKRLDDLGFTANRVREALGGVSLQAASMQQVMDAVTKLMDEDMRQTGGYVETTATKVERLQANIVALKTEFAKKIESGGFLDMLNTAIDRLRILTKAGGSQNLAAEVFSDELQKQVQAQVDLFHKGIEQSKDKVKATEDEVTKLDDLAESYRATVSANEANMEAIKKEIALLKEKNTLSIIDKGLGVQKPFGETKRLIEQKEKDLALLEKSTAAYDLNRQVLVGVINQLFEYKETLKDTNIDEADNLGIIERKRQEIENLQDQIEATNKAGDLGVSGTLTLALKKAQEELDILLGKSKDSQKKAGDELRDYLGNLSDLDLYQTRTMLDDRIKARKDATEAEIELEKKAKEERERLAKEEAQKLEDLRRTTLSLAEEFLHSSVDALMASNDDEIEQIRDHYDKQIELAGDNERAKKELRIKQERELEKAQAEQKERDKRQASTRILIDGLVAIAKIFGDFGWPAGIAPAAIMAGITATNVATVRKYAKGGINIPGPGTETSDSIPSMLSKGESIITAQATRHSMGLLEAIQSNKIDDRIMKNIDFSGGRTVSASLNDERIVNELKAIRKSQGKIEEQAGIIYRVYTDDQGNKQRIRSKSI